MTEVYAFLADGLEEVECLAVADVLIRGGVNVTLVSIGERRDVSGSHGFRIMANKKIDEVNLEEADLLFLPGGMPGTKKLGECKVLCDGLLKANQRGKRIAAICAAPGLLGDLGILEGRKATCYPGFEDRLTGAEYTSTGVVTDQNITTARGLGYALDLGIELLRILKNDETALRVKQSIQYDQH
ncbi:MAG: DJ-1/PfpI family protein [Clostridium sp.]